MQERLNSYTPLIDFPLSHCYHYSIINSTLEARVLTLCAIKRTLNKYKCAAYILPSPILGRANIDLYHD